MVGARADVAAALWALKQSGGSPPADLRRSPPLPSLGVRGLIEEDGGHRLAAEHTQRLALPSPFWGAPRSNVGALSNPLPLPSNPSPPRLTFAFAVSYPPLLISSLPPPHHAPLSPLPTYPCRCRRQCWCCCRCRKQSSRRSLCQHPHRRLTYCGHPPPAVKYYLP